MALAVLLGHDGCSVLVPVDDRFPAAAVSQKDLEVEVRCAGAPDPVPLSCGGAAYSEVPAALRREIAGAAEPWAREHRQQRPGGFRLFVELTQAEARRRGGRLTVALAVRATLSARVGQLYLAQTQAYCRESARVAPAAAAPVFHDCMAALGRTLAGWLGGVQP